MKRFFTLIIALVMTITLVNAQTVEHSRLFENTYVTLWSGGITTTHPVNEPFFWDGAKTLVNGVRPFAGLEVGKYVTPVLGLSVEGLAMFNTTGSNTIVDQHNVVANMKFNLSNWFGGYRGEPRVFEVVLVPGLGWGHDYGNVYYDRNYLTYNAAVELNFNLGKKKALQINVKPVVMYNNYKNALTPFSANMEGRLQVGLTYKFGSTKKSGTRSHNFVLCPYSVTKADYDALQKKYDELANRAPEVKEVVRTVVELKEIPVETPKFITTGKTFITFEIGSSVLSATEKAKIEEFVKSMPEGMNINLVGSADTKTGTDKINNKLAAERAEVVKNVLVKEFGVDEKYITTEVDLDAGDKVETSRAAVMNVILR